MTLRYYLTKDGYRLVDDTYYGLISTWKAWYRGKVDSFHRYKIYTSGKEIARTRASLNMAKAGAEHWAGLLWNNACAVNLDDEALDTLVNDILRENDFGRQFNQLTERSFALGTGALIAYKDDDHTVIDYVNADCIFPLAWRNDEITSCAFAGAWNEGKRRLVYLMIHEQQPNGSYIITNKFFEQSPNSDQLTETATPDGVQESYKAQGRRFAIVKPNLVNNASDAPMGLSVYANSIDVLKSIDMAYDGARVSMEIGRPRIGVSSNMVRYDHDSGGVREVFDADDIAVYVMGDGGATDKVEVKDLTTPYRAKDFETSLQAQLPIYAQSIGLSEKTFQWQRESLKTATEVISADSAMLRTMVKHQEGLRTAITQLVRAILDISGKPTDTGVKVVFDDSTTRDKRAEAQEAWQWVLAGRYPFWRYLMDFKGYDEAEAKGIEAEAQASLGPDPPDEE